MLPISPEATIATCTTEQCDDNDGASESRAGCGGGLVVILGNVDGAVTVDEVVSLCNDEVVALESVEGFVTLLIGEVFTLRNVLNVGGEVANRRNVELREGVEREVVTLSTEWRRVELEVVEANTLCCEL